MCGICVYIWAAQRAYLPTSFLLRPVLDTPPEGQRLGCSGGGPVASQGAEMPRASGHMSNEGGGGWGPEVLGQGPDRQRTLGPG